MKYLKEIKGVNDSTFYCETKIYNYNYTTEISLAYFKFDELIQDNKIGRLIFESPIDAYMYGDMRFITIDLYLSKKSLEIYFNELNDQIVQRLIQHEYNRLYERSLEHNENNSEDYQKYYTTRSQLNKIDFKFKLPQHKSNDNEARELIKKNINEKWINDVPKFIYKNNSWTLIHNKYFDIKYEVYKGISNKPLKYEINYTSNHSLEYLQHEQVLNLTNAYSFDKYIINNVYIIKYSINDDLNWNELAILKSSEFNQTNNNYTITLKEKFIYKISVRIYNKEGQHINCKGSGYLYIKE
jgi:hypothetical protein